MLRTLARACYERRRLVLLIWLGLFVAMGIVGNRFGGDLASDFTLPASESQRVFDLLQEEFPQAAQDGVRLVVHSDAGLTNPEVRSRVEALLADLRSVEAVRGVGSPYEGAISPDGRVGFTTVQVAGAETATGDFDRDLIVELKERVETASGGDLEAFLGGPAVRFVEQEMGFGNRELIGVAAAIVILLVTFGSVIAMGLPILIAAFGLGVGMSIVFLLAHVFDVPEFAPQLALMIGLGVGIDYALFIVTRFRQALHGGSDPEDAVEIAIDTSGRAVIFAGLTVVISLLGLFIIGLPFVQGLAVTASIGVAVVMVASITLLPAILGFAGHAIDRLHVPGIHRDESDHRSTFWFRWSRLVQRRPIPAAIAGTAVLVLIAIPLFSIELGFTDEGNDPPESGTRQAYDLLAEGFGPGFNGPLLLVSEIDDPQDMAGFGRVLMRVAEEEGIVGVTPPITSPGGSVVIATAFPSSSPQSTETRGLIEELRGDVIPGLEAAGSPQIELGGITALFVDFSDYLQGRLFYFIGAVLVLSFLLLMTVFRSLLIPLKAAIVNLLGIGAAYGTLVAVFQWGWLADVFGVARTGPIEPFLPMMLFAIVFGLSMDYEVFLMSRIREEYVRTGRNDIAVADGLAATARVITAAAAIMVTLFLSFALADVREIKLFGLGLAVAIFLDATVIRMVVVPSFMEMFGEANWWLPRRLDRFLPKVSIEGAPELVEVVHEHEEPKPERTTKPKAKAKAKAKPRARARPKAKPKAKPKTKPKATAKRKATTTRKPASKRKPAPKRKPTTKRKPSSRR